MRIINTLEFFNTNILDKLEKCSFCRKIKKEYIYHIDFIENF